MATDKFGFARRDGNVTEPKSAMPKKILIDIDGTITHAPEFFSMITNLMHEQCEIHIVTCRSEGKWGINTVKELAEYGIKYHHLVFSCDKQPYVGLHGINIVFEDMDEFTKGLPEDVLVFKIRETHNFDWKSSRWIYDDNTGIHVEDL